MRGHGMRGVWMILSAVLALAGAPARASAPAQKPVQKPVQQNVVIVRDARRRAKSRIKPETMASWHARRGLFFQRNWGVDIVGIRRVASGMMLRFDYRVVDPAHAVPLNDKNARPYLIDEATGTALAVPAMENIGELRQVAPYQANRTYFILFGNPGGFVKHGAHVTLVVGELRAEGLVVD